ncbi:TPA: C47 family peptidase [Enterococcus faecium]
MVDLRYLENYSKQVLLLAVSFAYGYFVSPSELKLSNFNFRTLTNECENKFIFSLSTDSQTIDRLSKAYGQKYLNLDFLENQGKTSWCAAYATTAIIRYQTRKSFPTARQMMTTLYPSSSNLADESASNIQCISYANSYGFHSISNRWGQLQQKERCLKLMRIGHIGYLR